MATDTFNSGSANYTVPAGGPYQLVIESWGAGGGGGSGDSAPGEGGAGGGGGGYSKKTYASVASGTVFAYSVGAAGSGQTGDSEQDGGAGGNTTVTQAGLSLNMAANGGGGGISGANGNGPGTGGAGGTASGGDTNTTGTAGTDTTGSSSGKAGGAAANGGAGGAAGIAGTAPGGGGGGGNRHGNSGAGAAGRVSFTYTAIASAGRLSEIEAWQTLLSGEAGYSSQALVNRHFGYNDTQYTIQQAMYLNNAGSQGKSVQQMIYENIKTGASLTDPFTRYTVQDLLNAAISASVSAETVLGA